MTEWFEEWFGEEYLALYPHRDLAEAARAVALIRRTLPWQNGWRVLDVACGAGRHSRALRDAGARCFGLDLSAALLRRARSAAGVPLVRADMRALPIRTASMNLTVNLFTSFGYFATDEEHCTALVQMAGTLRPSGWLVLDFLNAAATRAGLVAEEQAELAGRPVRIRRELSDGGRFVWKRITAADGREFTERVRLFGADELVAMLDGSGITVRHRFGDYDGGPLTSSAPRVMLMGERR
jgi:SAM-dependent methyltransferase